MSNTKTNQLVILDRDGVINFDSDQYIKSEQEWIPIESSMPAIAKLNRAGIKVGVATNQSGISRGYFDTTTLALMHKKMEMCLAQHGAHIDYLVFCPDHPNQPGPNRKPQPGMANQLLSLFNANPKETWFVGDSLSDIECANNSNCRPALVLTGKGKNTVTKEEFPSGTPVFENLAAFVEHLQL
jgi:D-glycero-D-manno-heptose 1,7-bisphosphate phosphatase